MAIDPNDPRRNIDNDGLSRRSAHDPAAKSYTGLIIGAVVVLGALVAFLMFRNSTDTTTVGMNNPPAITQQQNAPNAAPIPTTPPIVAPAPPAATPPMTTPPATTPPAQ